MDGENRDREHPEEASSMWLSQLSHPMDKFDIILWIISKKEKQEFFFSMHITEAMKSVGIFLKNHFPSIMI